MSSAEPKAPPSNSAVTGVAMDRIAVNRRLDRRVVVSGFVAAVIVFAALFWLLAPRAGSQTVDPAHLTIAVARQGVFEDFLPLRSRVTPLRTVYLDAVEGGRVEKLVVEDGAHVAEGQLLAVLSNADLQLSTLARQTEVEQQLNNMRSQELALSQARSGNRRDLNQAETELSKSRRQHDLYQPLAKRGFVSAKTYNDAIDDLTYQQRRLEILRRSVDDDERLQSSQLAQLRASAASLNQSLAIARGSLGQLQLRAPVAGQLSGFSIQLGQSLERGARVGQIDSAGRSKLVADVDEFYLGRVAAGQSATMEADGNTYLLRVSKIYPQVRSGQFQIDLIFNGTEPPSLRRGQTMQTKLALGDAVRALLIPTGAFFNDTGGNWVFVVDGRGRGATRRPVQLGRRNIEFIEVLGGLKPGDRVVTSSYSGLTAKTHLNFQSDD